ncbi:UDP-N-acetylmuramate dehydrogenase [Anaerosporobacter faecicola]|uniref:UDP-N-acetylmuramate dehydrogenase n=1 Tax=Anaerosporobacter faecicola TaxID=2718714 RepID=UPI002ED0FC4B
MNDINQKLMAILSEEHILRNEPLAKHTTFKIGGPAAYLVTPTNKEQVKQVIEICKECDVPFYVIGKGSNLLVGDQGYRGVIIQIYKNFNRIEINGNQITAEAGVMLARLAKEAAEYGLSGLEGESGIPGTLGGAVTMNAGAYGYEIKDHIISATVLRQDGEFQVLDKSELQLGYRNSIIQKEGFVAIEATFQLSPGKKEEILETMKELNQRRADKQPLEYPSAGSTFKRPEGYFAGKLIMDAGLAGYRVGDIMVSDKHCGFVVNVGNGTAAQVRQLIEDVQRIVYEKNQVRLEPEVRFLGDF